MSTVLVVNSGSSSLKYEVIDATDGLVHARGLAERIGQSGGVLTHVVGADEHVSEGDLPDHEAAMAAMAEAFGTHGPDLDGLGLVAVGHRVVQGGDEYAAPVVIDDDVVRVVTELIPLAPLHNPANLAGIKVARERFPALPHVAVFDTAFHATLPEAAYTYAIDAETARTHRVRRYGFHGTSHEYVSREAARMLGREPGEVNVIVLHLGNGASVTAVRGGVSVDTSMGLTPLEGLVMGTRSGDIDPAIIFHLARHAGLDIDAIDDLLNKKSGVLGLSGRQDMRDLVEAAESGDAAAGLALEVYCHRLRKYVGAYAAVLGHVDAVAFTAGVGENSAPVRARAMADLAVLGIEIDQDINVAREPKARDIATSGSRVRVLVIPTNEELEIARQTLATMAAV